MKAKVGPRALGLRRRKPLTAEQSALVERHVGLADRLASRAMVGPCRSDPDAIRSAAHLGLVDAASRFDPSRGLKFVTMAYRRILGAIQDERRGMRPRGFQHAGAGAPSVANIGFGWWRPEDDDAAALPKHRRQTIEPTAPDDGAIAAIDFRDTLDAYAAMTSPSRAVVLRRLYGDPDTPTAADLARALGIGHSGISYLHDTAVASLRRQLTA